MSTMTAEQARDFDRTSVSHAAQLSAIAAARGCNCRPYADWFTYNRWLAQGYQVKKGQHGVALTTLVPRFVTNDDGERVPAGTRPRGVSVFCRCQVEKG